MNEFRSFGRPTLTVVHPPTDDSASSCVDCQWVSEALDPYDCRLLYESDEPFFHRIAIDCLNVDAFLHFMPAMFKQSFGAEGPRISATMVWVLGAEEWDRDQTILEQILPRLNSAQMACVLQYLHDVQRRPDLDAVTGEQLQRALRFWSQAVAGPEQRSADSDAQRQSDAAPDAGQR